MAVSWLGTSDIWLWVFSELHVGPVVVEGASKGGIGMSILWHWGSKIRLRILSHLKVSPIVMKSTGESRVWVSILRHWCSNVWLWVFPDSNSLDIHESKKNCNSVFHFL